MPPSGLPPADISKIVAYIRSLRATASDAFVPGDADHGEQIFRGKGRCDSCHMIRGRGGILGPDLSNSGGERPLQYIRDALTKPRHPIPIGYHRSRLLRSMAAPLGIAKNNNNFSLQFLDTREHLQLFTSDELRNVIYKEQSLMPSDYDKALTPAELQDLLAYLSRQLVHKVERRRRSR